MKNRLADATSPYLLQHADNPVNWYPWGPEALAKARAEDKPIFLSIGYSACHWCHVMAHESFEDSEVAEIMRQNFVSIKVDREERPDLDSIYMSAVVALTGQGGWPLSVFLTPDLVPFYGGTYFPPKPRYGMPSFKEVLTSLANVWRTDRDQVLEAGKKLSDVLQAKSRQSDSSGVFTDASLAKAARKLINQYDWQNGGWGRAPKFPQPMALAFLVKRFVQGEEEALKLVSHALHSMARGGMYDVLGGGFSRYSTDNDWLVPHFEKMLYDNAQLTSAYLHAWQITREPFYRQIVDETLTFVCREMLSREGGFYASLDADSEGVEGKFYVWKLDEIRAALGGEDDLFEAAYGIDAAGNWEGKIILQRVLDDSALADQFDLTLEEVQSRLAGSRAKLLSDRDKRVRPGTDDKILTFWNGLMLSAVAKVARVFENERYLQVAQRNADFLLNNLWRAGHLHRSWRDGRVSSAGFLEDYAALILGLIELYQTDFDSRWYQGACELTEEMVQRFGDPAGGFFDTPAGADPLLIRPKEMQDNATPSGNALAVEVLLKMAAFSENEEWRKLAEKALSLTAGQAADYPLAFGRWLSAADFYLSPTQQIAIMGDLQEEETKDFLRVINREYRPNSVVALSNLPLPEGSPTLLADRTMVEGKTTVYVCEGFVCKQPVNSVAALRQVLK
ncbi:thioredoxin domain-containing protein [bacterium]|nr:thioredoxin domain-containing protein [bacterium]